MCGIYGFAGTPKDTKKVANLMKQLAIETEERGIHSTGYVAQNSKSFYFAKKAVRASTFVEMYAFEKPIVEGRCHFFVGHNRWASCGEINDINAHPFRGSKYFLVHNGTCSGAPSMAKTAGLEVKGTTDSEAVLHLIEKEGGVEKADALMNNFCDFSLVLMDYRKGHDMIYFLRDNGKPMVIFDLRRSLGIRVFASTRDIVVRALLTAKIVDPKTAKRVIEKSWSTKVGYKYQMDATGELTNMGQFLTAANTLENTTRRPFPAISKEEWYQGLGLVTGLGGYYAKQAKTETTTEDNQWMTDYRNRICNRDYRRYLDRRKINEN